jgi:hypothetical protein
VTSCATAHERAVNPSSARIGMQSMYNLLSAPSTSMLPQAGLAVSSKHTLPHAISFPTSALKLTQPRYPGKKQHQYHCLRCSHWTLHNSPKCQLSNVHKGFQSHLGSILPTALRSLSGVTAAFQSHLGSILPDALDPNRVFALGFQSHLGSILPYYSQRVRSLIGAFQSHLGSILPDSGQRPDQPGREVSIPPWFDFAYIEIAQHVVELPGFNPTLVRFCRLPIRYSSPQHRGSRKVRGSVWIRSTSGVRWIPSR